MFKSEKSLYKETAGSITEVSTYSHFDRYS